MKKISNVILEVLLSFVILMLFLAFGPVFQVSKNYARTSPQIAYMQYPILILTYLTIGCIILSISMGLYLVHKSNQNNIFEIRTVKILKNMGHCFIGALLLSSGILIYGYVNIQHEIGLVGTYLILFMLISLTGANLFYFISNLFLKATHYKEENEMTV